MVERLEERTLLAAPAVNLGTPVLSSYTERDPAAIIAKNATVTGGNNATFAQWVLKVATTTNKSTDDMLAVASGAQIQVVGAQVNFIKPDKTVVPIGTIVGNSQGTDALTVDLLATADLTSLSALVEQVTYQNNAAAPASAVTIAISVDDGSGAGGVGTATQSVAIARRNDTPVVTPPADQATDQDTPVTLSGLSVTDDDSGGINTIQVTLQVAVQGTATTGSPGTLKLASTSGLAFTPGLGDGGAAIQFTGTLADIQAALTGLSYRPGQAPITPTGKLPVQFSIQVVDPGAPGDPVRTVSKTSAIAVQSVADLGVVITSDPSGVVQAGKIVTYKVTVTNYGPSAATAVAVGFQVGSFFITAASIGEIDPPGGVNAKLTLYEVTIPTNQSGQQVVATATVQNKDPNSIEPTPDPHPDTITSTIDVGGVGVLSLSSPITELPEGNDPLHPNVFDVTIHRDPGTPYDDFSSPVTVDLDVNTSPSVAPDTDYRIILPNPDGTFPAEPTVDPSGNLTYPNEVRPDPVTHAITLTIPGQAGQPAKPELYTIEILTVPNLTIQADNRAIPLSLQNPTGGASLAGQQTSETLTIKEDDSLIVSRYLDFGANPAPGTDTSGTLRQVLATASAMYADPADTAKAPILITFAAPSSGTQPVISLIDPLPAINFKVDLNGTSQDDSHGRPTVAIDGSKIVNPDGSPVAETVGLLLAAVPGDPGGAASTVRGLIVQNFTKAGVEIDGSNDALLNDRFLGNGDMSGADDAGVLISGGSGNTIGGASAAARVVLASNQGSGVRIAGAGASGNLVLGDYIGTTEDGLGKAPNARHGVDIAGAPGNTIGGPSNSDRNIISGNAIDGVVVQLAGALANVIQNNIIGLGADGTTLVANAGDGVAVVQVGDAATPSGVQILGDVVSDNAGYGVHIDRSFGVTASGNFIGTDLLGAVARGNGTPADATPAGVFLDRSMSITLGGTTASARNVIAGNVGSGVRIGGLGATANVVEGNAVGTAADGGTGLDGGVQDYGVYIDGVSGNVIGGSSIGSRNVISGNRLDGVLVQGAGAAGTLVQGNSIGLQTSGLAAAANGAAGVVVAGVVPSAAGMASVSLLGNVISGNAQGVSIGGGASGVLLAGNLVGTNAAGTGAVANGIGVDVASPGNTIGGTSTAADQRNVISGNSTSGIHVSGPGATGNLVRFNYVGTDSNGSSPVPNGTGVDVEGVMSGAASPFVIRGNVISGNATIGLMIGGASAGVSLVGNQIGTNAAGIGPVPNQGAGVAVQGSSAVTLGGVVDADRNIIAGNGGDGVAVSNASAIAILGNRIGADLTGNLSLANAGAGINLTNAANATIGGDTSAAGNLVDNNAGSGILVTGAGTTGLRITNNLVGIGTVAGGFVARGNVGFGIRITDAPDAFVAANAVGANTVVGAAPGTGIEVDGQAVATIQDNFVGTAPDGTTSLGNGGAGLVVTQLAAATIGNAPGAGSGADDGNVVAGNGGGGILVAGLAATASIRGNFIGTNRAAGQGLGNLGAGVSVQGSPGVVVAANVIGGNLGDGIFASGANEILILANAIGTDLTHAKDLGNRDDGIRVNSTDDAFVGGGDGAGNVIAHNGGEGVEFAGVSRNDNLLLNVIGVGPAGGGENLGNGVLISATAPPPVAGADAVPSVFVAANTIAGNRQDGLKLAGATGVVINSANIITDNGAHGVEVTGSASGNTVTGSTIDRNSGDGIHVGSGTNNQFTFNQIGTTDPAKAASGNLGYGVALIGDVSLNLLLGNVIAANHNSGVLISGGGATANTVSGNFVGSFHANLNDGVSILQAGPGNRLEGNTIDGNNNNGVLISQTAGTVLSDDFIGTDSLGNPGLGNKAFGVILNGATGTDIRGEFIAGNASHGVVISGGSGNILENDVIGLGPNRQPLGNGLAGVFVLNSTGNQIGLPGAGGNLIAANKSDGVAIFGGASNVVQGNSIGFDQDASGYLDRGNEGDGIDVVNSSGNIVGGTQAGQGNTILANKKSGVEIFGGASSATSAVGSSLNSVLGNLIGGVITGVGLGNKLDGVLIAGSAGSRPTSNYVGSLPDALGGAVAGNTIDGNQAQGIAIVSADASVLRGNQVGASSSGPVGDPTNRNAGNVLNGIGLNDAQGTRIEAGNVVEGNLANGVDLISSGSTSLQGNQIRENQIDGIRVEQGSSNNAIGVAGSVGNVIVNNVGAGVEILNGGVNGSAASTSNVVANNLIGVGTDGTPGANRFGVLLNNVAGNTVGGVGGRNVISGNNESGVQILGAGSSGDLVANNVVGLDPGGTKAVPNFDGVLVSDSSGNTVRDNVVSGNNSSGIQVFGAGSSGNVVTGNLVGSDVSGTRPVVGSAAGADVYSDDNRQDDGVLINNASDNVIGPGNRLYAGQNGVRIFGAGSSGNVVAGNQVGPDPSADGRGLADRLGNLFGIAIEGASGNAIRGNSVERNISVGVEIFGSQAGGNRVQANDVEANGGYGQRLSGDGSSGTVQLTAAVPSALVFGTGIYLDGARGNIVGSDPSGAKLKGATRVPENLNDRNTISDNVLVDIFLFNGATNNQIRSNIVQGGYHAGGPGVGEYGVFLFNSAGNLNLVDRQGRFANKIRFHRIAQFREFTGPVPTLPTTVGSLPRGPRATGQAPSIPTIRSLGAAKGHGHKAR